MKAIEMQPDSMDLFANALSASSYYVNDLYKIVELIIRSILIE